MFMSIPYSTHSESNMIHPPSRSHGNIVANVANLSFGVVRQEVLFLISRCVLFCCSTMTYDNTVVIKQKIETTYYKPNEYYLDTSRHSLSSHCLAHPRPASQIQRCECVIVSNLSLSSAIFASLSFIPWSLHRAPAIFMRHSWLVAAPHSTQLKHRCIILASWMMGERWMHAWAQV